MLSTDILLRSTHLRLTAVQPVHMTPMLFMTPAVSVTEDS